MLCNAFCSRATPVSPWSAWRSKQNKKASSVRSGESPPLPLEGDETGPALFSCWHFHRLKEGASATRRQTELEAHRRQERRKPFAGRFSRCARQGKAAISCCSEKRHKIDQRERLILDTLKGGRKHKRPLACTCRHCVNAPSHARRLETWRPTPSRKQKKNTDTRRLRQWRRHPNQRRVGDSSPT